MLRIWFWEALISFFICFLSKSVDWIWGPSYGQIWPFFGFQPRFFGPRALNQHPLPWSYAQDMVLGSADIIFHLFSVKISISDLRSIEWPNLAIFRVSAKIFWTQGTQPTSPPMILCSGYGFGKRWYHFFWFYFQCRKILILGGFRGAPGSILTKNILKYPFCIMTHLIL